MSARSPAGAEPAGRANQRLRTRKDLLDAAARLMQRGGRPTLEEVAQEAMVSRATAYRYFPSPEALMLEAAVHIAVPEPDGLFDGLASDDPAARLQRVDQALHEMVLANETPMRLMLASMLEQSAGRDAQDPPARQNRRAGLIAAALAPAAPRLAPEQLALLSRAAALLVGAEAQFVAKDVLLLDDADTRKIKQWALAALTRAALAESQARDS
ncbi:helix-turn-helix domain containing protein [Phenylobacterium sp. LjRoot219]|uniref:TetR/AcrR family transcriptional regulator n=1 Tax=Phenylobacterium sp. LjRoot219 TaxID=3342283 RepID=UPI003ECF0FA5